MANTVLRVFQSCKYGPPKVYGCTRRCIPTTVRLIKKYSSTNNKIVNSAKGEEMVLEGKGLVLGAFFSHNDGLEFTKAAIRHDSQTGGELSSLVKRICPRLKKGEVRIFYDKDSEHVAKAVVGLGDRNTTDDDVFEDRLMAKENVRVASGAGVKALQSIGLRTIEVEDFGDPCAAAEGSFLSSFVYNEFKSKKDSPVDISSWQTESDQWKRGRTLAESQNFARYLMESPSNILTPQRFVDVVSTKLKDASVSSKLTMNPRNKEWIAKKKMNAFLAVAKGSAEDPWLFEASYHGSSREQTDVVLVGKGVTFDTGGISIKPSANMDLMRGDMGGAACVVSALLAAVRMSLPINITVLAPLCENMPSGNAVKPGDVVEAMNGKTIQIDNTDAEGRLILADALHYAHSFNPSAIVDLATLTGAMDVALGAGACGVFSNSDDLWIKLHKSGQFCGDRMWRMPLFQLYSDQIKSHLADINNISTTNVRSAGACTAAAFLSKFVTCKEWAHVDIAGVMRNKDGLAGRPTRTVVEYLNLLARIHRT